MSDHRDPRRHETQSISGSGHPRTSRVSDDWRHESRRPVIHSDPSDGSRTQPKPHGFSPTSPSRSADAHTTIDPGNSRSNATRRHSVYRYKSSLPDTISKSRVQEQYRPSPPPDTVRNRGRSSDSATSSRYPPSHKRSRSDSVEGRQDRVESVGPRDRNFQRAPVSGPTLSAGATSAALSKLGTATSPPYSSDQASTLWTEKTPDAWGFTCRHMGLGRIFYFPANSTVDDVLRLCPLIHTDVASNGANSYILVMDSTCSDGKSATHDLCFGKLKLDTSIMPHGDNRNRYEYSVERLIDPDSHPWWKDPVNLTHVNPSQEVTDERVRMWRLNSAMRTLRAAREAQDSALRAVERVMSELTLKRVDEKAMILDKMGFSPDPNGGAERDTVSTIIKRVARGEAEFGKLAFKTAQSSKGKSECSCSSERLPTRSACGQTEAVDREVGSQAMIVRSGSEDGDDGLLTRREKIKGGDTVEKSDADIPRTESSSMKRVRFVGLRGEEDEESPMKRDMVSRKRTSKIRKAADEGAVKNADKQTKLPESEELSRTDRSSPMKALELFSSDTISMLDGVKTKVNEVNTLLPTFRSSSKDFDNATKLLTDIRAFDDRKELERIERQAREKCGGPTSSGRGEETFSGRLDASASRTEWEQGAIDSAL